MNFTKIEYSRNILVLGVFLFLIKWISSSNQDAFYLVPLTLSSANLPRAVVEIQGKSYALEVDLGSKHPLALRKEILDVLAKTPTGTVEARNFRGVKWVFPTYLLNKIRLQGMEFINVIAVEKSDDSFKNSELFTEEQEEDRTLGMIGRPLLEKMNFIMDTAHRKMIFCHHSQQLKKAGYDLKQFSKVPFIKGRIGPIISVTTDFGVFRFAIDTGSTFSHIRASLIPTQDLILESHGIPYFMPNSFKIENQDFGLTKLYLVEITSQLHEIDGVLGMDFIQDHLLYIDHKEQAVYIKK